jgi:asparagine synthase (glutamine-hydrolysing)
MLSEDGGIGLVFNGCIYNFQDLRRELEQCGHSFRSNSDTEVLLLGYREWGIDALVRRLRGMFAFAIWDQPRRTLTLARDRLGVKPLVWTVKQGAFAFASTLGGLRAAGFADAIDEQAVMEFLEFGFVTDERSIWQGCHKLPPATILEWQDGAVRQRCYWTLPELRERSSIAFEEAVEETERLLVQAVRLRLCADVPIGALLSGGIDSALVCWAVAQANAKITAFTVAAPGDPSDETAAAAETARVLGIRQEVVELAEDGPSLDTMLAAFSEPFGSQSALGLLQVSRAVKAHATVLLSGDGGDDVFLGYPHFQNAWTAQRLARWLPPGAHSLWSGMRRLVPRVGALRRARSLLDYAIGGLGAYTRVHDGLPYYQDRDLLGDRIREQHLDQRMMSESTDSAKRLLWDVFGFHRKMHFLSEFMPKVDGATMYYALEARAPFLDQEIWEFAATLPAEVRFRGGQMKAVLREIVRRRVGAAVAQRKKQGFTIPVERWLAQRWSQSLEVLREGTALEQGGWIRPGALTPALDDALRRQWVPHQLWYLLLLERWLRKNLTPPEALDGPPDTMSPVSASRI